MLISERYSDVSSDLYQRVVGRQEFCSLRGFSQRYGNYDPVLHGHHLSVILFTTRSAAAAPK